MGGNSDNQSGEEVSHAQQFTRENATPFCCIKPVIGKCDCASCAVLSAVLGVYYCCGAHKAIIIGASITGALLFFAKTCKLVSTNHNLAENIDQSESHEPITTQPQAGLFSRNDRNDPIYTVYPPRYQEIENQCHLPDYNEIMGSPPPIVNNQSGICEVEFDRESLPPGYKSDECIHYPDPPNG